jgi:cytochrome oxidase Cu insertion factor (SCO1/SenC/PrrC family)
MRVLLVIPCFAAIVLSAEVANAQRGETPRQAVNRAFAKAPSVGEALPDVTVYDDAGTEFPLSRLWGKHTVLVFGCLT